MNARSMERLVVSGSNCGVMCNCLLPPSLGRGIRSDIPRESRRDLHPERVMMWLGRSRPNRTEQSRTTPGYSRTQDKATLVIGCR